MGRVVLGQGTTPAVPPGVMRVNLVIHGGPDRILGVLGGLVQRNARAIREGKVPASPPAHLPTPREPRAWLDAPSALLAGAGPGTRAAWRAAARTVRGQPVRLALVHGIPAVVAGLGDQTEVLDLEEAGAGGLLEEERPDRWSASLRLVLDDDRARPVAEIGTEIARHNAERIRGLGLPPLYSSGVRYQTEGAPEKWWDAEEILAHGHDDCEGLAAYRAGELLVRGIDASVVCRPIVAPAAQRRGMGGRGHGGRLFHAITEINLPSGRIHDDPSARLGMPVPEWYKAEAARKRARGLDL